MERGEYEIQLFGFNSANFIRAVRCAVKEEVAASINVLTEALIAKYPSDDPEIDKVKELTKTLLEKYISSSNEPLQTLQSQVEEMIKIPAHCLLPSDTAQRNQYTAEEEAEADAQIKDLHKRLKRTQAFDVELQRELEMLKEYLPRLQQQVLQCDTSKNDEGEIVLQSLEPAVDRLIDEINMMKAYSNDEEDNVM